MAGLVVASCILYLFYVVSCLCFLCCLCIYIYSSTAKKNVRVLHNVGKYRAWHIIDNGNLQQKRTKGKKMNFNISLLSCQHHYLAGKKKEKLFIIGTQHCFSEKKRSKRKPFYRISKRLADATQKCMARIPNTLFWTLSSTTQNRGSFTPSTSYLEYKLNIQSDNVSN
jgi:hypothetical protein